VTGLIERARKAVLPCAAVAVLATGCITDGVGPKQAFGGLGAAAIGGLAGAQIGKGTGQLAATATGTLAGFLLGSEIGSSLDKADEMYAEQALAEAQRVPVGQPVQWSNGHTGNRGVVVPVRDGYTQSGDYCREYQQTVYVGGRKEKAHGVACREPDGTWRIVGR
jgi:surface antigen